MQTNSYAFDFNQNTLISYTFDLSDVFNLSLNISSDDTFSSFNLENYPPSNVINFNFLRSNENAYEFDYTCASSSNAYTFNFDIPYCTTILDNGTFNLSMLLAVDPINFNLEPSTIDNGVFDINGSFIHDTNLTLDIQGESSNWTLYYSEQETLVRNLTMFPIDCLFDSYTFNFDNNTELNSTTFIWHCDRRTDDSNFNFEMIVETNDTIHFDIDIQDQIGSWNIDSIIGANDGSLYMSSVRCLPSKDAINISIDNCLPIIDDKPSLSIELCLPVSDVDQISTIQCLPVGDVNKLSIDVCLPVVDVNKLSIDVCLPVSDVVPINTIQCLPVGDVSKLSIDVCLPVDTTVNSGLYINECMPIKNAQVGDVISSNNNCLPVEPTTDPVNGQSVDEEPQDPIITPPSGTTSTIPVQETYTMNHIFTTTLEDGTPIDFESIDLKHDAESHSLQFNGMLADPTQQSLLQPNQDGTPVVVKVTVDNRLWRVLIENTSKKRKFGETKVSLSGRGLSALLDSPYMQQKSWHYNTPLTIDTIVDLILPNDWTLNWQAPAPLIPANTFSIENKSPANAILEVCKSLGLMMIPHRNIKTMTIKPRYPVLPWNYATTAPDLIIPESAIIETDESPQAEFGYNGIYLNGTDNNGVIGFAKRQGTAGDKLLGSRSNQLIVDNVSLRSLADRLLAAGQPQPIVTRFSTFMDGNGGIVDIMNVGSFVELQLAGYPQIKAILNSVSIKFTRVSVRQNVTLGEKSSNLFNLFKSISPESPKLLGTVASVVGDTSIVNLVDGGTVNVLGVETVGTKVFVKDNVIIGKAPNMTLIPTIII